MSHSLENRRRFIKLASALMAAPFACLRGGQARANAGGNAAKPPLRLLTILDSYGLPTNRKEVWADPSGDYALTPESLGTVLSPLAAYTDKMLVLSGVSMDSMAAVKDGKTHDKVTSHTLTGSGGLSESGVGATLRSSHASLDVHVGQYLNNSYGLVSPRVYPHVFLSDYAESGKTTFSFDAAGQQIRSVNGANNIANTLFGGGSGDDEVLLDVRNQLDQEVLTMARERVQSLRSDLVNANAKTVLDAYQSSVNELSQEIALRGDLTCIKPDLSTAPADGSRSGAVSAFTFETIHQAFACDLASSVTYTLGGETINQLKYGHVYDAEVHNDAELKGLLNKNFHAPSHRTDVLGSKVHEVVRQYQATMIADLLDKLSVTPDVDGSTLLSNTVVFWTSAMSNNTHKAENYGQLLVAGENVNLKGGFHYDCSGSTTNDLLTTVAQGLTLPDDHFGGYDKAGKQLEQLNNGPIAKMLEVAP